VAGALWRKEGVEVSTMATQGSKAYARRMKKRAREEEGGGVRVVVKPMTGPQMIVWMSESDTIDDVKARIAARGDTPEEFLFVYRGHPADGDKLVSELEHPVHMLWDEELVEQEGC